MPLIDIQPKNCESLVSMEFNSRWYMLRYIVFPAIEIGVCWQHELLPLMKSRRKELRHSLKRSRLGIYLKLQSLRWRLPYFLDSVEAEPIAYYSTSPLIRRGEMISGFVGKQVKRCGGVWPKYFSSCGVSLRVGSRGLERLFCWWTRGGALCAGDLKKMGCWRSAFSKIAQPENGDLLECI